MPNETSEVRVYLHGGGDSAIVRGSGERGIKLRLIGGKGDNQLVDSSHVALDAHAEQSPKISRVWLTSTKPWASATLSAQCSTAGPSTSTVRPQLRHTR